MPSRIQKLQSQLNINQLDALLITNPTNVRYLTNITTPNSSAREALLLLTHKQSIIFASPLLAIPTFWQTNTLPTKSLTNTLQKYSRVGFEANHLTVSEYDQLKSTTTLVPTTQLVEKLRIIKDSTEIRTLIAACKLTSLTIKHLHTHLQPGTTEVALAWEAEKFMRQNGASGTAFPTIIASGPNSAIPHHITSNRKITKHDIVLVDLGAKVDGYCGDMTRTFFVGTPTAEQLKIESIVKSAHMAGLSKPNAKRYSLNASQIDSAVRQAIENAGYGKYFIHSTGHGLGLDIHEPPSISLSSSLNPSSKGQSASGRKPYKLEANMVITIEPGIYLPHKFGYRHEDTILITKNGYQVLTSP